MRSRGPHSAPCIHRFLVQLTAHFSMLACPLSQISTHAATHSLFLCPFSSLPLVLSLAHTFTQLYLINAGTCWQVRNDLKRTLLFPLFALSVCSFPYQTFCYFLRFELTESAATVPVTFAIKSSSRKVTVSQILAVPFLLIFWFYFPATFVEKESH